MLCTADDDLLLHWHKVPTPFLPHPPSGQLTAWRDPCFIQTGDDQGKEWIMLIGSGLKEQGGAILVYRAKDMSQGRARVLWGGTCGVF
jgi:hypothetical protein